MLCSMIEAIRQNIDQEILMQRSVGKPLALTSKALRVTRGQAVPRRARL